MDLWNLGGALAATASRQRTISNTNERFPPLPQTPDCCLQRGPDRGHASLWRGDQDEHPCTCSNDVPVLRMNYRYIAEETSTPYEAAMRMISIICVIITALRVVHAYAANFL